MVIKVFLSRTSGNILIKEQQAFIMRILSAKHIAYEEVDISAGGAEQQKRLMQEKGHRRGGKPPLPPQVFSDNEYLGDYEDFYEACECESLYNFLRLPEPKKVVNPNLEPVYKPGEKGRASVVDQQADSTQNELESANGASGLRNSADEEVHERSHEGEAEVESHDFEHGSHHEDATEDLQQSADD